MSPLHRERIIKKLTEDEKAFFNKENKKEGKPLQYQIGENFAAFLGMGRKINPGYTVSDNGEASYWIKKEYKKRFGKKAVNKLDFDPESSYCYIYTTDKEEAIRFELWAYERIIKPALEIVIKQIK